jgi:hypothetical protein
MARHRRPAPSGGRVFQRQSRHTGTPLATWWIAYYVDGKERRESAHSADLEVAQRLLRTRLHAVDDGTFVGPERERLTVPSVSFRTSAPDQSLTTGRPCRMPATRGTGPVLSARPRDSP